MKRSFDQPDSDEIGNKRQKLLPVPQLSSASRAVVVNAFETFGLELKQARKEQVIEWIKTADRQKHSKLFESVVAHRNNMLLWEDLPCEVLESKQALRYKRCFPDFGADCASSDLTASAQAKWIQPNSMVSFRAVSTFVNYSNILGCSSKTLVMSEGVKVCSTGARSPGMLQSTITDAEFAETIVACVGLLAKFDREKEAKEEKIMEYQPRPYQIEAEKVLLQKLQSDQRIIRGRVACGAGKTFIGVRTLQKFMADLKDEKKTCLWLVPSIQLLYQAADTFKQLAPELSIQLVGDDHKLDEKKEKCDVILCTYQSVVKVEHLKFAVVVVDEGHHVEEYLFADNEDEEEEEKEEKKENRGWLQKMADLQTEKFLLLSATLATDEDNGFGPSDFTYDIEQAITERFLCDYEICIPVFEEGKGDRQVALANLVKDNGHIWTATLAYCNSCEEAKRFRDNLLKVGVTAEYIDGTMSIQEREAVICRLENGTIRVIVSVYVLGEGIDVPPVNCVLFVEPRSSAINVSQCIGRGLRLWPGKHMAHVVLPATDEEQELKRFLRIIQESDKRIIRNMQSKGARSARVNLLLNSAHAQMEQTSLEVLYMAIFDRMLTKSKCYNWMEKYELVKQFVLANGKLPQKKIVVNECRLGAWISEQKRQMYHPCEYRRKLTAEEKALLQQLPGWSAPLSTDDRWMKQFEILKLFVLKANRLPTTLEKDEEGNAIGSWLDRQKNKYRGKFRNGATLTDEQKALLEQFSGWSSGRLDQWMNMYNFVMEFYVKHKRMPFVKERYNNIGIGQWLTVQRMKWTRRKSAHGTRTTLTEEQKEKLAKLPFWTTPQSKIERWQTMYDKLMEWVNMFKRLPSLDKDQIEYKQLYNFCHRVRKRKNFVNLSDEQKAKLRKLRGWRDPI